MATPGASVMISPSRVFLDLAVMRRKFLDPLTPKCINHRYKQCNNPLISWDVLVTLNQRVPGSSPGAPTIDFTRPFSPLHQNIEDQLGGQLGAFVPFSSLRIALSASAGSRCR